MFPCFEEASSETRSERDDGDADDASDDKEAIRTARVRGAEFTSKKIHCLEIKARESYLKLLEQLMKENFDSYLKHSKASDRPRHLTEVRICILVRYLDSL